MKKTYIIPEIKIVKIRVAQMIAASTDLGVSETHYDGSTSVESRKFGSIWDDDEE